MSKKIIVIICSIIVVLAGGLLLFGVSLAVDEYRIYGTVYSEEAKVELKQVHEVLDERLGSNLLFVKEEEVSSVFDAYPYLSVSSVEKVFPKRVDIVVEEKMEVFAIPYVTNESRGYCMVDKDGIILCLKGNNVNRIDGGANVLVEGVEISNPVVGTTITDCMIQGEKVEGLFSRIVPSFVKMHTDTQGLRSCIAKISISSITSFAEDEVVTFHTTEGVTIQIQNPELNGELKAELAVQRYLSLNDTQKLFGKILSCDDKTQENGVLCSYTSR